MQLQPGAPMVQQTVGAVSQQLLWHSLLPLQNIPFGRRVPHTLLSHQYDAHCPSSEHG
jgi:hypothetical protein